MKLYEDVKEKRQKRWTTAQGEMKMATSKLRINSNLVGFFVVDVVFLGALIFSLGPTLGLLKSVQDLSHPLV